MIFARFVYGTLILIEGDYLHINSKMENIFWGDWVSIISLIVMFPILSFYAGAGNAESFAIVLGVGLLIDAIIMHFADTNDLSAYDHERKAWAWINGIIALFSILFMLAYIYGLTNDNNWVKSSYIWIGAIVVYIIASFIDFWVNRDFYLGRKVLAHENPQPNQS